MKSGKLDNNPTCPQCKKSLDGFTTVDHDERPKPDDVTICCYCREVLQFDNDMNLKTASPEAIEECVLEVSIAQRMGRYHKLAESIFEIIKGK